ncbi:MAG: creatininase family protein [Gemmatimonadota bacterium]|nr:creatininase family protein [Gemmatimonadota bacterium]
MTATSWALDELTWPDIRDAIDRDPRLILPVGALEQHGPHLPLGTNSHIAVHVARALSERVGILRAPCFSYGAIGDRGPYAGAVGLRRKTLHRAINELLGLWEDHGIAEFLIISAHRYEPHLEALLMALTSTAVSAVYDLYRVDVSDLLDGDPGVEHAGELETSLMLHLAPHLVHTDRIADFRPTDQALRRYTRRRAPTPPLESGGTLGAPSRGEANKGAAIFQRYVSALSAAMERPPTSPD